MTTRILHVTALAVAGVLAVGVSSCGDAAEPPRTTSPRPRRASAPRRQHQQLRGRCGHGAVYWVGTGEESDYLLRGTPPPVTSDIADPVARAALTVAAAAPSEPRLPHTVVRGRHRGNQHHPDGTVTVDLPAAAFAAQLSEQDAPDGAAADGLHRLRRRGHRGPAGLLHRQGGPHPRGQAHGVPGLSAR
ncbi:hypothetical protein QJS66_03620 [Kocuria rhizophila]|nr:hypothetical protein QJS66_03620 [Kocuria rhizophila]